VKIKSLALAVLLTAAAPAFAGDVDGKWKGSIDTPNGAVELNYTFKSEGQTLTGFTTGPDGSEIPIKDGKVDGQMVSFSLTLDFGAGPTTFNYTGELSPTELKLKSSFMDMPFEFTLKKA
jgi:hypothetical protein